MTNEFAQKFTTTNITGGVRIYVVQKNPGDGKGTTPVAFELDLYQWDTDYSTTVQSANRLVRDRGFVPSEEIENSPMWIFLYWKPLPPGTYLWMFHVYNTYMHKGVFQVYRDTNSTYHDAFEDGVSVNYDFYSLIMGLDSGGESHEDILSLDDTFAGGYTCSPGHSNPQVNRGTTGSPDYVNTIYTQDTVMKSGKKAGRIATGSFVHVN